MKVSVIDRTWSSLTNFREQSPKFEASQKEDNNYPARVWRLVEGILLRAAGVAVVARHRVSAAAIVGISPVLVLFDTKAPDTAVALPYWYLDDIDAQSSGHVRTRRRVMYLDGLWHKASHRTAAICDLIGYLNFRLTGQLTMNTVTAGELGIRDVSELFGKPSNNRVYPILKCPSSKCGAVRLTKDARFGKTAICAGAPDSFAAAFGAGALIAGTRMIYLGTFGSLLEVIEDLDVLTLGVPTPCKPYRWRISVPGFGSAIERYARANFPSDSPQNSLGMLDLHAMRAEPGARGLLFHLPTWDNLGVEHGSFGFIGWHENRPPPCSIEARAVLESVAYLVRAKSVGDELANVEFRVAGGGASSSIWMRILADVLGRPVTSVGHAGGALGAAAIAGTSIGWKSSALTAGTEIAIPTPHGHLQTQPAADRASSWYARQAI